MKKSFPKVLGRLSRVQEAQFLPAALEIIETPPSPLGRCLMATICLFFLAAAAWAWEGRVDIVATAPGKVIIRGRTKVIQPQDTGTVTAIHVADGQRVHAGDVLLEIDPTSNAADTQRFGSDLVHARLDIARLRTLLGEDGGGLFESVARGQPALSEVARARMAAQKREFEAKLASLDQQIVQRQQEKAGSQAGLAKIEAALPLAKERASIRERLLANEFGSRLSYLEAQQAVVEMTKEREVLQHKVNESLAGQAALTEQREQAVAEFRRTLLDELAKAETRAAEAESELTKAQQKMGRQTLGAPVDGVVQQLAVHTLGAVVMPAQQLMQIVPTSGTLEIEAVIANKDVGFVAAGQSAEIKVDTYTFTRYGLLHGTVHEVSSDAVPEPAVNGRPPEQGTQGPADDAQQIERSQRLVYVAHVSLEKTEMDIDGRIMSLGPGMAVTAEIKTGSRRLMDFLLSPLNHAAHDAFRER